MVFFPPSAGRKQDAGVEYLSKYDDRFHNGLSTRAIDRKPVLLVKWKLSAMALGRSLRSQMCQVLLLGFSFNGIA